MVTDAKGHEITRSRPNLEELKRFFFGLAGIKIVHNFDKAIVRMPDRELSRAWQRVRRTGSVDERLAFAYGQPEAIPLLVGSDMRQVTAAASHLTQLPPLAPGASVLDVGGGPGHLALWMLECWPESVVTVLDRHASAVARDWTPALASAAIRFVDGDVPGDLSAVAEQRFDRVVMARMLAQGADERVDLRPRFREALTALKPLVADDGDLVVIDHFHGRDAEMFQELANISTSVGFDSSSVRGWQADGETPWQLRFVNRAQDGC